MNDRPRVACPILLRRMRASLPVPQEARAQELRRPPWSDFGESGPARRHSFPWLARRPHANAHWPNPEIVSREGLPRSRWRVARPMQGRCQVARLHPRWQRWVRILRFRFRTDLFRDSVGSMSRCQFREQRAGLCQMVIEFAWRVGLKVKITTRAAVRQRLQVKYQSLLLTALLGVTPVVANASPRMPD